MKELTFHIIAVLVNYNYGNRAAYLIRKVLLLPSISRVIVIDNASLDNSIHLVENLKDTRVTVIKNKENLGYDKAVNIGIKQALLEGCRYVMLLDADLIFKTDFITRLAQTGADVLVPVLKFRRKEDWIYDYGGKVNWILGRTYHIESTSRILAKTEIYPDFVSGGCTLIRKEVFDRIGLYDERFFLYFGDADFALRARKAGFEVVTYPRAIVIHNISEHKFSHNWFKTKLSLQGNLTFINKWISWYFRPFAYTYFLALISKVLFNLLIYRLSDYKKSQ